ncbi:nuclear transport factor 2 family protein [Iodidimonas sp. SYSU 1G8]|uniref:nuclear transport factor 2 family protein n=1 Tax=Iodidimonas sp. SYSU 1G8 TaxID=3133967 RepID=UPI0031FEEF92
MDGKMQRVIDDYEIRQLLYRYTRGVDRGDAELVSSVYDVESTDDHGGYKGPGKDFGPYVVKALAEHTDATMHTLNQSIIDIHHETAKAETYFVAYHVRTDGDAQYLDRFGGRYLDKLKKRNGEWSIIKRVVVRDWSTTDKIEGSYYKAESFENGKRSKDDLAYTL